MTTVALLARSCVLVLALTGAGAAFVAWNDGPAAVAAMGPRAVSSPYLVAPSCERTLGAKEACRVAVRYLHSLDLDRFERACRLLARDTLENAGGIEGCVSSLRRARGIRIRYGIHGALETSVGTSVRFRTRSIDGTGPGTEQTMVVRSEHGRPRIWLVATTP